MNSDKEFEDNNDVEWENYSHNTGNFFGDIESVTTKVMINTDSIVSETNISVDINDEKDTFGNYSGVLKFKFVRLLLVLIENFIPVHFVAGMGIGILGFIFHDFFSFAQNSRAAKDIGIVIFFVAVFTTILNHVLFLLKYVILPTFWRSKYGHNNLRIFIKNPNNCVFFGASAMSFTSLINMVKSLQPDWSVFIKVFWFINMVQSLLCVIVVFYIIMKTEHKLLRSSLEDFLPTLFLAVVPGTVNAACGFNVVSGEFDIKINIICVFLWSFSVSLAFILLTLTFLRYFLIGIPSQFQGFTNFIPIGIMGQASFGILLLAENVKTTFKLSDDNFLVLLIISGYLAIFLLAIGILLTIWGLLTIALSAKKFGHVWNNSCWGITFPFGTMVLSTFKFYEVTNIGFFRVLSSIYLIMLMAATFYCMVMSFIFVVPWKKMYNA